MDTEIYPVPASHPYNPKWAEALLTHHGKQHQVEHEVAFFKEMNINNVTFFTFVTFFVSSEVSVDHLPTEVNNIKSSKKARNVTATAVFLDCRMERKSRVQQHGLLPSPTNACD